MGPGEFETQQQATERAPVPQTWEAAPFRPNLLLHAILFALTFVSIAWSCGNFALDPATIELIASSGYLEAQLHLMRAGLPYAVLLTLFLLAHEFGHYFAARAHGVVATLPYFLPMPLVPFGTLGAVIRTRSPIMTRRALFDIGVAGPIAGFVVALAYLIIGTVTFPGIEAIFRIHPQYESLRGIPDWGVHFGGFLLLDFVRALFTPAHGFFPPANVIYHFPFLAIGWFAMVVTSLNLLPLGQLDGGHITYAMFGERQRLIGRWFARFMFVVGLGFVGSLLLDATRTPSADPVYRFLANVFGPLMEWIDRYASWWFTGSPIWLFWAFIVRVFLRTDHPPIADDTPLDRRRMIVGWIALAILVLTFSYTAIYDNGTPEVDGEPGPRERNGDVVERVQAKGSVEVLAGTSASTSLARAHCNGLMNQMLSSSEMPHHAPSDGGECYSSLNCTS
jgi:membrane-associated protease RseP (regulator of RpoE activity)